MDEEKRDELARLAGRVAAELRPYPSASAFPFNYVERFFNWLLDQLVKAVGRLVMWFMPRMVKRIPAKVTEFLVRTFAKKRR